jgi:hypothetical protein
MLMRDPLTRVPSTIPTRLRRLSRRGGPWLAHQRSQHTSSFEVKRIRSTHMTTPERESILNAHNLLFTVLSLSLLVPKAVLSYKGESAAPNALDWAYGILLAVA